ncbi:hypothetical protein FXN61_23210, partial [Lentzea sp. PSKA42]
MAPAGIVGALGKAIGAGAVGSANGAGALGSANGAEGFGSTGASPSVISGRVSYALGLEGPSVSIDT